MVLDNTLRHGNPGGEPARSRALGVKSSPAPVRIAAEDPHPTDVLWFEERHTPYCPRGEDKARSTAGPFHVLGLDLAMPGNEEKCIGERVRLLGRTELFDTLTDCNTAAFGTTPPGTSVRGRSASATRSSTPPRRLPAPWIDPSRSRRRGWARRARITTCAAGGGTRASLRGSAGCRQQSRVCQLSRRRTTGPTPSAAAGHGGLGWIVEPSASPERRSRLGFPLPGSPQKPPSSHATLSCFALPACGSLPLLAAAESNAATPRS